MKKNSVDWYILIPVLLLTSIGLIMVLSSSSAFASGSAKYGENPYYFFKKQVIWAAIGLVVLGFGASFKYSKLKKYIGAITVVTILLLIIILLPGIADPRKGATSWLQLGPVSFQPSEFVKLCTIIILAYVLANKKKSIRLFQEGLLPPLLITASICVLILLQRDLGTTMALAFTSFTLFFAAGARIFHLSILAMSGIAAAIGAILIAPYRFNRVLAFWDPFADPTGIGWQIVQSLYAIGSGGLVGVGIGHSRQKFLWIPESHTDFIYSIIAEELGFIGGIFIIILFIILLARGLKVAFSIKDSFGGLLAVGITTMITVEAIMNVAVATDSMPVTGITLPFVSYGGSSLVFKMLAIGILMNISKHIETETSAEE